VPQIRPLADIVHFKYAHTYLLTSDSDADSCTAADEGCLVDELGDSALRYNVLHVAVTALLGILPKTDPSLPKDARSVLNTESLSSAVDVKNVAGGSYYHFGLGMGLFSDISAFGLTSNTIKLIINIDGLPFHKSTAKQFWPILGKVANCKHLEPFVIGLFAEIPSQLIFLCICVILWQSSKHFRAQALELETRDIMLYSPHLYVILLQEHLQNMSKVTQDILAAISASKKGSMSMDI